MTSESRNSPTEVVEQTIRNRRSVKPADFTGAALPDEAVWKMLSAANWAPNHGRTEPWRFFVYSGEQKATLAAALEQMYRQITPVDEIKPSKIQKLHDNCSKSSHLIMIGMKRQESGKIPEFEEIAAVACAVQNLHLMAVVLGAAGYWSSGTPLCSDELRRYLGMADADRLLGMFYLGCPQDNLNSQGVRTPIEDKVVWKSTST